MGKHIEFIARGLCIEGGNVLVCVSVNGGYGYLPGGHVEFDESASVALAREFQEECGIAVRVQSPILGLEFAFEQNGKRRHEVSIVFPVERDDRMAPVRSLEPKIRFERWPLDVLARSDLRPHELRDWLVRKLDANHTLPLGMAWITQVGESRKP